MPNNIEVPKEGLYVSTIPSDGLCQFLKKL